MKLNVLGALGLLALASPAAAMTVPVGSGATIVPTGATADASSGIEKIWWRGGRWAWRGPGWRGYYGYGGWRGYGYPGPYAGYGFRGPYYGGGYWRGGRDGENRQTPTGGQPGGAAGRS